ncbi:MAG: hypothetical protein ACREFO_18410 [Acetobacteraceae bacterium]
MANVDWEVAVLRDLAAAERARRAVNDAKHSASKPERHSGTALRLEVVDSESLTEIPRRHVSAIDETLQNPWRMAIRTQVREVGWRLYASGGMDAMHKALDKFEDATNDGRFVVVIDHAWNMIGLPGDSRGIWVT